MEKHYLCIVHEKMYYMEKKDFNRQKLILAEKKRTNIRLKTSKYLPMKTEADVDAYLQALK